VSIGLIAILLSVEASGGRTDESPVLFILMPLLAVWTAFWFCGSLLAIEDIREGNAPVFPILGDHLQKRGLRVIDDQRCADQPNNH